MNSEITYEAGRAACRAWYGSAQFGQFARDIPARDVARVMLPPVPETEMQVMCPLPRSYQDWLRGFEDERAVIAE